MKSDVRRIIKKMSLDCPCTCHLPNGGICDPPFCCELHWTDIDGKWWIEAGEWERVKNVENAVSG